MAGRVTKDPVSGVATIELSADAAEREEQLQDPEVARALAGEGAPEVVDPADAELGEPEAVAPATAAQEAGETLADVVAAMVDEALGPIYLDRHKSPTKALIAWFAEQLRDRVETIEGVIVDDEGTHWNGVKVVPWPDVLAILGGSIPQPHPLSAEIADGGDVYVVLDCPKCDIAVKVKAEVDVEFKLRGREGGVAQLKAVFKTKPRTHVCGQQELPLDHSQAAGQTEAFPAGAAAATDPEPEETELDAEARLGLENDVVKLLDQVETTGLVDDDRIGIPPEEDVRAWSTADLRLAYEWAWARIHETEQPPVPTVLVRAGELGEPATDQPRAKLAAPDFELDLEACTHEGDGQPDCRVCHPELDSVGTGDPDGDLLP